METTFEVNHVNSVKLSNWTYKMHACFCEGS